MSIVYGSLKQDPREQAGFRGLLDHLAANGIKSRSCTEMIADSDSRTTAHGERSGGSEIYLRSGRAVAWEIAQVYLNGNARLLIADGFDVARALAGNRRLEGKFWIYVDEHEASKLISDEFSRSFLTQSILHAGLVIGSGRGLKKLRTIVPGAGGKFFEYEDGESLNSARGASSRLSGQLTLNERYQMATARTKLVVEDIPPEESASDSSKQTGAKAVDEASMELPPRPYLVGITPESGIHASSVNVIPLCTTVLSHSVSRSAWDLKCLLGDTISDLLVVRSLPLAKYCLSHEELRDVTWLWIDDSNFDDFFLDQASTKMFKSFTWRNRVLVGNEALRSRVELSSPEMLGRVTLWDLRKSGSSEMSPATFFEEANNPIERYLPSRLPAAISPRRLVVAGHDLKFFSSIHRSIEQSGLFDTRFDVWPRQDEQVISQSKDLSSWAEVIWCEFGSRNSVWYSKNKLPGQRLIVRVHGYELFGGWTDGLDMDAVDLWVFVSEHAKLKGVLSLGIPDSRTTVIPNVIDFGDLSRKKFEGARYNLGLVGMVPAIKRPDRALDLLEILLGLDDRYALNFRSGRPFDSGWIWTDRDQRDAYEAFYERLASNSSLRRKVSFDSFGSNMGHWYRKVGWVLSPSTRETFHLAPIEGMASGSVPVVWAREGAADIFPIENIFDSSAAAASYIHRSNVSNDSYGELARSSSEYVRPLDIENLGNRFISCLLGVDLDD
ncbi:hypothetical protein [Arthrobacter sp. CAL618]|uniref:hypothetical protein n=1 Tax=Arthrobacter sp. CAL618 TaxID=1055770 RepID=UPI00040B25D2|nr:hypothetical protein [Arthrobacter sp. CAL618]